MEPPPAFIPPARPLSLATPADIETVTMRHIKAAQAGSLKARDILAGVIGDMIRDNDATWLRFLVTGVHHFQQNNCGQSKQQKTDGFVSQLIHVRDAADDDPDEHLDGLRDMLRDSLKLFGDELLYLWAEATSKAMASGELKAI